MLDEEFVTLEIGKTKHIALVAHDGKKKELVDWCDRNKEILKGHFLCGTGTTAKLIAEKTGLPVKGFCSGPLGGDQQIGAKIVEGQIDFMIFLWDPLEAQPHDPDVKALLRIEESSFNPPWKIPGVSTKTIWASFKLRMPMIESRVVWAFGVTIETFFDSKAFNRVLLPTLGRPSMATNPDFINQSRRRRRARAPRRWSIWSRL